MGILVFVYLHHCEQIKHMNVIFHIFILFFIAMEEAKIALTCCQIRKKSNATGTKSSVVGRSTCLEFTQMVLFKI